MRVKLAVEATSWRPEGAYPIESVIAEQLTNRGVEVVPADDSAGTVSVVYKAGRSGSYVIEDYYAGTSETVSGTRITLKITVTPTGASKPSLSFDLSGKTQEYFYGSDPHQDALERLRADELYTYIGTLVSAALGSADARLELLGAGLERRYGTPARLQSAIKKLGIEPRDDVERAVVAVTNREWKACAALGLACGPAVSAFLVKNYMDIAPADQDGLEAALLAIATSGGEASAWVLSDLLESTRNPYGYGTGYGVGTPLVFRAIIRALAATNDPLALFGLTRLSETTGDPQITVEAKQAQAQMIEQLRERPRAQAKVAVDLRWRPTLNQTPNLPAFIANAIERARLAPVEPSAPADGYFLVEYREPKGNELENTGSLSVIAVELRAGKLFGPLTSPVTLEGEAISVALLQQTAMINAMMTIADCAFSACRIPEALQPFIDQDYALYDKVMELMRRGSSQRGSDRVDYREF